MPSTFKAIDALTSQTSTASSVAAAALASLSTTYRYNNTILLPSLEERLQTPLPLSLPAAAYPAAKTFSISANTTQTFDTNEINSSTGLTSISHVASVVVSNFLPLSSASLSSSDDDSTSAHDTNISSTSSPSATFSLSTSSSSSSSSSSSQLPLLSSSSSSSLLYTSYSPPVVESLVASSAEEFSNNFRDLSFDIFDDNDNDLFGSPLAFDASENGLWNGRFVPPPPRPPFFVDEPVLSDGLTTCDLCSWAMPTKSTFIFEGTMEKASELGWPLTLTIVSIFSAILGAIIMIAVVKCRRKKTSHQRSDTHVQWWSRNKRPNGNNNHLRRSNIYTAHPADSIRGLQQPNSLSASSSMTAMTTAMTVAPTAPSANASTQQMPYYHAQQQQQPHAHTISAHFMHHQQQQQQQQQYLQQFEHEHEYHQPQELQLQLQPQQPTTHFNHPHHKNNLQHHHHLAAATVANSALPPSSSSSSSQHQHSASMSSSSTNSMPSLSTQPLQMQIPEQIHLQSGIQPQHVHMQHKQLHQHQHHHHHQQQPQQQQQNQHQQQQQQQQHHEQDLELEQSSDLHDNMFHWPTATSIVTS